MKTKKKIHHIKTRDSSGKAVRVSKDSCTKYRRQRNAGMINLSIKTKESKQVAQLHWWHNIAPGINLAWQFGGKKPKHMNGVIVLRSMSSINDDCIIQRIIFFSLRREMWENKCVHPSFS